MGNFSISDSKWESINRIGLTIYTITGKGLDFLEDSEISDLGLLDATWTKAPSGIDSYGFLALIFFNSHIMASGWQYRDSLPYNTLKDVYYGMIALDILVRKGLLDTLGTSS